MTDEQQDMEAILEQINKVLTAAENNDLDTIYDHRAAIVSMYAQAMV